ncbi:MAG: photosystem I assembly protein Ycf4, partial [Leptolyngbya sp. SIO1D8]|nr:photosystem I assembly protein Ycf4 [Leptolyngbya sp. SIO1D8]
MTTSTKSDTQKVLKYPVLGGRRLSNYWWAVVISVGATGFLLAGLSSYLQVNLLPFADPTSLIFVPQGIA